MHGGVYQILNKTLCPFPNFYCHQITLIAYVYTSESKKCFLYNLLNVILGKVYRNADVILSLQLRFSITVHHQLSYCNNSNKMFYMRKSYKFLWWQRPVGGRGTHLALYPHWYISSILYVLCLWGRQFYYSVRYGANIIFMTCTHMDFSSSSSFLVYVI